MFWALVYVILVLVLFIIVDWCTKHDGFEKLPGPKGLFLLENTLEFLMDPGCGVLTRDNDNDISVNIQQYRCRRSHVEILSAVEILLCIWGHGSAPAKSSAKQTLPYHPLLEPFRRIFRPLSRLKLFYYFRSLSNQFKHHYKLRLGPKKVLIVHNPEDAEVIISGIRNSSKGFLYRFLQPWLQEGLLLSDGAKWQHRRKILTPTFHFNILRHFCSILADNSEKMVLEMSSDVGKERTNVTDYIVDFTLNSICETAMGVKLDPESCDFGRRYKDSIHTLGTLVVHRSQRVWTYPDFMYSLTANGRKQKELLNLLGSFRDNVINKRRENNNNNNENIVQDAYEDDEYMVGKKKLAMLDLLLQAEKEGIIDAKGIGEEVDTFMFEGHDTTSTALQFAFMLLANSPEEQEKVAEECYQIFGDTDRPATMADLGKMKYLECCIKEAIRLYPPVAFIMRKTDQDLKLKNGNEVPAGIDCAILIYDLQRRNDQFVEPQQFRPERFLKEPTWHPYAYIPFSAGPRNCIGQKFAMMEMKHSLSAAIRRFRLLPVTKPEDVVFVTDFILRPTEPIYIKVEKR